LCEDRYNNQNNDDIKNGGNKNFNLNNKGTIDRFNNSKNKFFIIKLDNSYINISSDFKNPEKLKFKENFNGQLKEQKEQKDLNKKTKEEEEEEEEEEDKKILIENIFNKIFNNYCSKINDIIE